jgi:hypothetical protein
LVVRALKRCECPAGVSASAAGSPYHHTAIVGSGHLTITSHGVHKVKIRLTAAGYAALKTNHEKPPCR